LTRAPQEISIGEVMRVLEGPISPMICATEGETEMQCERQLFCSTNLVWERVAESVAQALDSLTLADLIPSKPEVTAEMLHDAIYLQPITKPATAGGRNTANV
jgi:DNA-binding IscR family transcriptional regulator